MRPVILALAVALGAAPAVALAQAAGKVTFLPDSTVGQSECVAGSGAVLDSVTWTIQPDASTTFLPGGAFRLIGSNTAPPATADGSTKANYCYEPGITSSTAHPAAGSITSGFLSGPVPGSGITKDIPASSPTQQLLDVSIPALLAAAGQGACTGTTDVTVYVCVHYYPQSGTTTPPTYAPTPTGYASGTLTLSFAKPPAPKNVVANPGNRRLVVSFGPGDVTGNFVASSQYSATATPVCTTPPPPAPAPQTCDPAAVRTSSRVSSSPAEIDGLVNFQLYDVTVTAYSAAGNAGNPSAPVPGTPEPTEDFWTTYKNGGGLEQGGCATGSAGGLALLALASLSLLRRRAP